MARNIGGDRGDAKATRSRARSTRARAPQARDARAPDPSADERGPRPRPRAQLAARQAARRAVRQVLELTGREPEHVISVAREGGEWHVGVEVVELHRIPDSTDIMAVYRVGLDEQGELITCERERRYHRGSSED